MRAPSVFAILLASLVVALAPKVLAEGVAECSGTVVDENGVPVSAAQLKLEDASGKTYQAETDGAGRFQFHNLPAGDYKAEVRKEGFFVLRGEKLRLASGSNETAFTLNHEEEIREKIDVTAPVNQIDPQDTAQRETLTAQQIRDIPVPNSHILAESLVAMPEIVQDNQNNLHVAGARSGETEYFLDGFEIGDPANGALTSRFNIDSTRAAEVQTGRIGAGYAHSGANILNFYTPDGDDRWRFGTTDPTPGINIQQGAHLGNWYPRFTFSGPIERGKFWFSESVSIQHTFAIVKELPSNANTSEEWAGDSLLRLQFNISPKQILHGSFLYNRAHDDNLGLDALDPQSTTVTAEQRREFVSLKDQIWLHDTLIDVGVAADQSVLDYTPQGTEPFVILVNGTTGNYFARTHQRGRRLQSVGSVTAASRHWHGSHELSIGYNVAGQTFTLTAERGEIQALRADGTLVRQTVFTGSAAPRVSNTQVGGYLQDNWSLSKHLVVQAGLRTDWDRFTQSAIAEPRLAANALPFGNGRSKFSLGWGIYDVPLNLSLIAQSLDQQQVDNFYDPTGKIVVLGPIVSQFALPASGLRQPRFTNYSASWQQKFGKNTLLSFDLLARNGHHGFAYVDQQPIQPGGIFLLEDQRKDRYRSATVSVRHAFSEATEVYGAYTRSEAHSNQVLNPMLGSIFYAAQQPGPVAWDAPNRFLSWGWTPTHVWGIQLSYFLEYRSGYPFSAVNLEQQLVGPPNSLRFPDYVNVNLGLEKKFQFHRYLWAARIEAVNVFGRENPNVVVNNTDAPNFGTFTGGQGRAFTARVRFIGKK